MRISLLGSQPFHLLVADDRSSCPALLSSPSRRMTKRGPWARVSLRVRSEAVCPLMVTSTSEPSVKVVLAERRDGDGSTSRSVVVVQPARQVVGVNGDFQSPFGTVGRDVVQ